MVYTVESGVGVVSFLWLQGIGCRASTADGRTPSNDTPGRERDANSLATVHA